MPALSLVLTCEHACNRVPREHAALFRTRAARAALASHRGYDPGALHVAQALSRALGTPLLSTEVTRLLVEVNRSLHHPRLFSEFSRALPREVRDDILARHYTPHRARVEAAVARELARAPRVLHVAVHSFTPELDGEVRNADFGLLYDPRRLAERELAVRWQPLLERTGFVARRNYPYHGASDGLTTHLRRACGMRYLGFELEINQALLSTARARSATSRVVCESLAALLAATPRARRRRP